MARTRSAVCNQLLCLTMIAYSAAVAGCADNMDPVPIVNADLPAVLDGEQLAAIPWQSEVRYTQTENGDAIAVASPGWMETSPGLWKGSEATRMTMIIGAAGHRAAIAEAEQRLAVLQHQAGQGANHQLEIEQQSAQLAGLKHVELEIARLERTSPTGANALSPICNFSFYIGPSSTFGVAPGGAALATVTCAQACQWTTSSSRVCTNLVGCSAVQQQSMQVCGAPVVFGMILPGTRGAACSGAVTLDPPVVGQVLPFACG